MNPICVLMKVWKARAAGQTETIFTWEWRRKHVSNTKKKRTKRFIGGTGFGVDVGRGMRIGLGRDF